MMDWRQELESIGDRLEVIARLHTTELDNLPQLFKTTNRAHVFAVAWDLKQVARAGTASQGI